MIIQNETGFIIERKKEDDISFAIIDTVEENVVTYEDTTVFEGTIYIYRVKAFAELVGESDYSNEAAVATLLYTPGNLTGDTIDVGKVKLSWQDNSEMDAGYIIERKGVDGEFMILDTADQNAIEYIDTTVKQGRRYFYRVKAFGLISESPYSNEVEVITSSGDINAPTDLIATPISLNKISLSWSDNSDNELGFFIERKDSTLQTSYIVIDTVGENSVSYVDSTVLEGRYYVYRVKAFNLVRESEYSNEAVVRTLIRAINPPSELIAIPTLVGDMPQVILRWKDNSDNEAGFVIERANVIDSVFTAIDTVDANDTTYTDVNVENGKEYLYRIFAFNPDTVSDYSNIAYMLVLVKIGPPAIVGIMDVPNDSGGQVYIMWYPSVNDRKEEKPVVSYSVRRRDSVGWVFVKQVPSRKESLYITIIPTLYDSNKVIGMYWSVFQVTAYGEDPLEFASSYPDSGYSLDNLIPHVPRNLIATVKAERVVLTWSEPEDEDFQYFSVYRDTIPGFIPGGSDLIGATTTNRFIDSSCSCRKEILLQSRCP